MDIARERGRPRRSAGSALDGPLGLERTGLHEQAADRLRQMIVHGTLAPGAPLLDRAEQVRFFALRLEDRWEQSIVEHQEILDAITAHDGARAGTLLGQHVGHTAETVARCLAAGWTSTRDAA